MLDTKTSVFRFTDVEVREREFSIIKAGEVVPVEPKAFRVLLFLLHNPLKLITKEELLDAVWGDTAVSENSLTRSIALLRRLLGDDTHVPRYIETVATVGYRFVCPVEVREDANGGLAGAGRADKHAELSAISKGGSVEAVTGRVQGWVGRILRRTWLLSTAVVVVGLLAAAIWYLRRPLPPPRITNYVQLTLDHRRKDVVGTDGNRLYLNILEPTAVGQVPISGGLITEIPVDLPSRGGLWGISSVSPDGASLLAYDHLDLRAGATVSIVAILGHPVRYLTQSYPAVFSPDGRFVLYATPHGDIYSMAVEGGEPRLILASPAPVGEIAPTLDLSWSPDGSTIRFSRYDKIWEVSSSGSNPHILLPGWPASSLQWLGRWTDDGKFFVFVSGSAETRLPRNRNFRRGGQLWAIDERRGRLRPPIAEPIQLTSGPMIWGPAVSARNGHRIFSRGMSLRGELVRYDGRSAHFDPYLQGISAEMLDFSRDGRYVAYVSFPDGVLWRADRDGSGLMQLTKPPFYPRMPRWSPDGSQIIFTDNSQNGVDKIYVISSQGGTPQRLVPDDDGPQSDQGWSPDGKEVVYCTIPSFSIANWSAVKVEVRIFDLVTRKTTTLPPRPGGFVSPRWSPDGLHIAGIPFKQDNVIIFDLKTHQWKALLRKSMDLFPNWSKDGRFIYFLRYADDRGIYRIPVSGGEEERIVDLKDFRYTGWFSGWLGLDPADAPLLLRDAGTDEIYALTLEER